MCSVQFSPALITLIRAPYAAGFGGEPTAVWDTDFCQNYLITGHMGCDKRAELWKEGRNRGNGDIKSNSHSRFYIDFSTVCMKNGFVLRKKKKKIKAVSGSHLNSRAALQYPPPPLRDAVARRTTQLPTVEEEIHFITKRHILWPLLKVTHFRTEMSIFWLNSPHIYTSLSTVTDKKNHVKSRR